MKYFQKIGHIDGVPKTHLPQSHENIFRHGPRNLSVKNRRDQGDGNVVATDLLGSCRRRAHRSSVAYPDTLAASDALTDNVDCPFVHHANGFGWTGTYTCGMAATQVFIEMYEARGLLHIRQPASPPLSIKNTMRTRVP